MILQKDTLFSIFLFFVLYTFIALGIDTYFYPGFTRSHLLIDSRILAGVSIAGIISLFINARKIKSETIKKSILFLLPFTLLITVASTFIEFTTYPNFVFSHFHFHYEHLLFIFLLNAALALLVVGKSLFMKKRKEVIFYGSIFIIFLGVLIRSWPNDIFFELSKEDHLFENLQVLFYTSAFVLSVFLLRVAYKKKMIFVLGFYLLFSLLLFFIVGEEISWGQRLLHIQTPEAIASVNAQKETTIHNLKVVTPYLYFFFLSFSFAFSFAWIALEKTSKTLKRKLVLIVPQKYLMGYFLPTFVFYIHMHFLSGNYGEWQEFTELLLAIGIFLFLWEMVRLQKKSLS